MGAWAQHAASQALCAHADASQLAGYRVMAASVSACMHGQEAIMCRHSAAWLLGQRASKRSGRWLTHVVNVIEGVPRVESSIYVRKRPMRTWIRIFRSREPPRVRQICAVRAKKTHPHFHTFRSKISVSSPNPWRPVCVRTYHIGGIWMTQGGPSFQPEL
jgi:hypothetical protein